MNKFAASLILSSLFVFFITATSFYFDTNTQNGCRIGAMQTQSKYKNEMIRGCAHAHFYLSDEDNEKIVIKKTLEYVNDKRT